MQVVSASVLEQWNTLPDEEVVRLVVAGQTALFEILMRRYNERIYRVTRSILRDEAEAEDVMHRRTSTPTPTCGSSTARRCFRPG